MLRDKGGLEHIVLCKKSIISVAGVTGTQCNSSDSPPRNKLWTMDCDFELLHSRSMVLPGKRICGEKGTGREMVWDAWQKGGPRCPPKSKSGTSYVVSLL